MLSVGIIGLPNVGKSTLFNALTEGEANVSNYPFTTIDSNVGMVAVPDRRLEELARLLEPEETTPCFVRFVDIAGLVEGASRGEGLGNQFLGHIREVDAVAHVVRCFDAPDVAHVYAAVDPLHDAEVVATELLLADLELLQRALAKKEREWKAAPKAHEAERERFERYRGQLEEGVELRRLELGDDERHELAALGLITSKPLLYVANVSEEGYGQDGDPKAAFLAEQTGVPVVEVSAKIEWELAQLSPAERREMAAALELGASGLERLVAASFELLGLIRFYTIANRKLRAWELPRGTRAPEAAGRIHSDMEEGFIRAQVATFDQLAAHGSFAALHAKGRLRTEGKDYVVRDGDVVEFLFSP